MQLDITDGFKFGCGFVLAVSAAGLILLMLVTTLVLLGMLFDVQMPGWFGFINPPTAVP